MTLKPTRLQRWGPSLAAAAVIAWMWSLPLLGVLRDASPAVAEAGSGFGLAFLLGNALGFLILTRDRPASIALRYAFLGPLLNLLLMVMLLDVPGIPTIQYAISVQIFSFVMGLAVGPLLLEWISTLRDGDPGNRGKTAGGVMLFASILYAGILAIAQVSTMPAFWVSAALLPAAAMLINPGRERDSGSNTERRGADIKNPRHPLYFWVAFAALLLAFYSLSWIAHTLVFPATRIDAPGMAILGALVYGAIAMVAGIYSDVTGSAEEIAMMGLAALFGVYVIAASGAEVWSLVNLLMEGSYGAIDLFVFAYLAAWAGLLKNLPRRTLALGLAINGAVVASGYILAPLLAPSPASLSSLPAAVAVAMALVAGNVAVIFLRRHREETLGQVLRRMPKREVVDPASRVENITPRETEVLTLILRGHGNESIARELGITKNTLKTHIRNLYAKAEVSNRSELILKINPPRVPSGNQLRR